MIDNFEAPKVFNEVAIKGMKDQATLDELRKSLLEKNRKSYSNFTSPIVTVDVFKDAL